MAEPAIRELERKDSSVAIVWRAFELRPDPVPTLDPDGDYLHNVWGRSVYPLAEQLGIDIKLPPVQPRSRRAHEAAHWARRHGKFRQYNDALFRALPLVHPDEPVAIGNIRALLFVAGGGLVGVVIWHSLRSRHVSREPYTPRSSY